MNTLQLGCGVRPLAEAVNHDRIKHSDFVDVAHDLDVLPWPWVDEQFERVVALDVLEHLHLEVQQWLDECWRILKPGGQLILRLPAWNNPVSYRDPTHRKVFHEETFHYWDPRQQLHKDYGFFYFKESGKWWHVESVQRVNGNDLGYSLIKVVE